MLFCVTVLFTFVRILILLALRFVKLLLKFYWLIDWLCATLIIRMFCDANTEMKISGSDCTRRQILNGTTVTRHRTDTGHRENRERLANVSVSPTTDFRTTTATMTITTFARKTPVVIPAYLLWPPIVLYRSLYFAAVVSFFFFLLLSSFFPRIFSAVGDWMSTILPHMMWP